MSKMLDESKQAPDLVAKVLASDSETYSKLGERLRKLQPSVTATVARGSSDHAATYASYLIPHCTGKIVASLAPSLVSVLKAKLDLKNQFLLTISQSGRSPDIIEAMQSAHKSGALTAAIVNDVDSPVAKGADFLLPQHAGDEGIAATKTVLCTLAAIARLVAEWSQDEVFAHNLKSLPQNLKTAFTAGLGLDTEVLQGVSNAYVLSRGLGLSSALETALKLKETCGIHAEAFSTAEVRHGPREIVEKGFMVIAIALPGSGYQDVLDTAHEMQNQGAHVMLVNLKSIAGASDPRIAPLLALQMLYPWLALSSVALGFNPDHPRTLKSKVIQTY